MRLNGLLPAAVIAGSALTAGTALAQDHHRHHPPEAQAPKAAVSTGEAPGLASVVASSPTRTAANKLRDRYRHPVETLSFFGIRPNMAVVEIWPGQGWYTEILAPYLQKQGAYYAAAATDKYGAATKAKLQSDAKAYGNAKLVNFPATEGGPKVPDGSADLVLTFRNVHNWMMDGEQTAAKSFADFYRMLKPGGVLGVVDHRLPEGADAALEKTSGYVRVSTVKRLAEQAGFRFDGSSEVNANPKDTKDYPGGVWTLPPTLNGPQQDRAKHVAIGESDRMTLRFVKPK